MHKKVTAIILAGGKGLRMNNNTPKQFLPLRGKPVIVYSLEAFEKSMDISHIVVVYNGENKIETENILKRYRINKIYAIVAGGQTRQESSRIGLENSPGDTDYFLIHDGARPFIDGSLIDSVLDGAVKIGASGPVIDSSDTLVACLNGNIKKIADRKNIKRIQTPQGFKASTIRKAHKWCKDNNIISSTDDCGMVLAMGEKVQAVEGSKFNIKITAEIDMAVAEKFLDIIPLKDRI